MKLKWGLDFGKFLQVGEVRKLTKWAKLAFEDALARGLKVAVRDYFIIDLALCTGLRVMEIAQLNCGDLYLEADLSALIVRQGKCGKKRIVHFSKTFKNHCQQYLNWKQKAGEPTEPNAPLILSSNTKTYMTTRALQKAFKRSALRAGLSPHYSIHCLRHTHACFLYKVSGKDIRLVQKQLGHSSVTVTEVYADVMASDVIKAVEKIHMWQKQQI